LYSSPSIIRMTNWMRITLTGHAEWIGKKRNSYVIGGKARRKETTRKMDLGEIGWVAWTGLIWLRIETSEGLLCTRLWTFGFHKMLGNSWVVAQLLTSPEELSSMDLVMTYLAVIIIYIYKFGLYQSSDEKVERYLIPVAEINSFYWTQLSRCIPIISPVQRNRSILLMFHHVGNMRWWPKSRNIVVLCITCHFEKHL
jgi:hypothetical protein